MDRDRVHKEESYGEILRLIILIVSPIILSSFIYNINGYLNGVLYSEIMGKHGVMQIQSVCYMQNMRHTL